MKPNAHRNAVIFTAYQGGSTCTSLAAQYGISKQRVLQIVAAESKARGEPLREGNRAAKGNRQ